MPCPAWGNNGAKQITQSEVRLFGRLLPFCHKYYGSLMVTRPKPRHRKTAAELLAAGSLRSHGRFLNEKEALELLRQAVELEGSQYAFAKRHAVDRTHLIYARKENAV